MISKTRRENNEDAVTMKTKSNGDKGHETSVDIIRWADRDRFELNRREAKLLKWKNHSTKGKRESAMTARAYSIPVGQADSHLCTPYSFIVHLLKTFSFAVQGCSVFISFSPRRCCLRQTDKSDRGALRVLEYRVHDDDWVSNAICVFIKCFVSALGHPRCLASACWALRMKTLFKKELVAKRVNRKHWTHSSRLNDHNNNGKSINDNYIGNGNRQDYDVLLRCTSNHCILCLHLATANSKRTHFLFWREDTITSTNKTKKQIVYETLISISIQLKRVFCTCVSSLQIYPLPSRSCSVHQTGVFSVWRRKTEHKKVFALVL